MDANSEHPIAKAIAASSEKKLPVEDFKSITGQGRRRPGRGQRRQGGQPRLPARTEHRAHRQARRAAASPGQDGRVCPRGREVERRDCPGRHRPTRGEASHRCPQGARHPLHDAHRRQQGDGQMGLGPGRTG